MEGILVFANEKKKRLFPTKRTTFLYSIEGGGETLNVLGLIPQRSSLMLVFHVTVVRLVLK